MSIRPGVLALLCVLGCLSAFSPPAGAAKGKILASASCRDGVQRPKRIILACADGNALVDQIRWSSWGGRVAVGSGVFRRNTCEPSCADGQIVSSTVTIRIYTRRSCPGRTHLYYQRATLILPGGKRDNGFVGCPVG